MSDIPPIPLSKLVRYVVANERLSCASLAKERAEIEYREAILGFRAMWHDLTPIERETLDGLPDVEGEATS